MARRSLTTPLGNALRALDRLGGRRLLETHAAHFVRRTLVSMSEPEMIEVLDALERAGVRTWVAGGWGVDALLGGRTRAHTDLDLVLDAGDSAVDAALAALAGLGIGYLDEAAVAGPWMPVLVKVTDRAGRSVDLCPVDVEALPAEEAFARGILAGRAVQCLSPALQVAFHRGYRQRVTQRADLRRLCRKFGLEMPLEPPSRLASRTRRGRHLVGRLARRLLGRDQGRASALIVPVPEADETLALGQDAAASGEPSVPAHITVLYPFVPAHRIDAVVERRVAEIAGTFPPFAFRLDRVDRFPDVLYLAPEPAKPFVELTRTFNRYWPEYPPYRGAYVDVVPHLTIRDGEEPVGLADSLSRLVPIPARAGELWLLVEQPDGVWSVRRRFPLGRVPAC